MIIRIHSTSKVPGGNMGSCAKLVDYLEKENQDLDPLNEEGFFNNHNDNIPATTVENMIDNNGGNRKEDTKFFMLTVNPSQAEIKHLEGDETKLKSYVNDLMNEYAKNFNRQYADGRPLEGKDIMYFAKVEHERTYKFTDKSLRPTLEHNAKIKNEIIKNLDKPKIREALEKQYILNNDGNPILEGAKKDGNNMHVHIIVSRYDYERKFKLSPLANQRAGKGVVNGKTHSKGFNRDLFVSKGEKLFDAKFNYKRDIKQSYNYRLNYGLIAGVTSPKTLAKIIVQRAIQEAIQDKTLQKATGIAVSDPRKLPRKTVAKIEKEALKAVMKALDKTAYTNPVSAGIKVAKNTITMVGKVISQSASI